ncbi:MAG: hypothetical protein RR712_04360 [Terrisporobacter sp.]
MIIKIWKEEDLELVRKLHIEVKKVIKENVQVLVEEYGRERSEANLGGFVAVTDEEGLRKLKEQVLKDTLPEYIDEIEGAEYISALFLLSNDFAVVVICEASLRPIIEG